MRTISAAKIADLMRINLYVERPHELISGLTVGELGGPLHKLVQMITAVLNETGEILDNSGYKNLGSFVAEALQQAGKSRDVSGAGVEVVLERVLSLPYLLLCIQLSNCLLFNTAHPRVPCVPRYVQRSWSTFVQVPSA